MVHLLLFVLSFLVLWKSADYFVDSSYSLAIHFKLPPILIGATIVAFGTSAPELFVTGFGAFLNQPDVVYGNILGSNIANILLIFGLSMILKQIHFTANFKYHFNTNIVSLIIFMLLLLFSFPSRLVALIFLILFIAYQIYQIRQDQQSQTLDTPKFTLFISSLIFLFSLIFLVLSSRLLVFEVVHLAEMFGLSKAFLSLFAVAFGTSLPELVTTVRFINRGHSDIVVGNVFGSNLFNLAFVLTISWLVFPVDYDLKYNFEFGLLFIIYFVLFLFTLIRNASSKWLGYSFVAFYLFYIGFIYFK